MKAETYCPICGRAVTKEVDHNYLYCGCCQLAVRAVGSRLSASQSDAIFGSSWVKTHFKGRWTARKAREVLAMVRLLKGVSRIVDVGCGSGALVSMLAQAGYDSVGLDKSLETIKFARDHCRGEYICGELFEINGEFDMVVMSHLLEHIEDPVRLLEQALSLLGLGGFLYIAVPNLNFYDARHSWRRGVDRTLFADTHLCGFSPHSLSLLLGNVGFELLWMKTQTNDTTLVDRLVLGLLRLIKGRNATPEDNKVRTVYEYIAYSRVAKALLYLPNKLSNRGGRGVELVALARKRSGQ